MRSVRMPSSSEASASAIMAKSWKSACACWMNRARSGPATGGRLRCFTAGPLTEAVDHGLRVERVSHPRQRSAPSAGPTTTSARSLLLGGALQGRGASRAAGTAVGGAIDVDPVVLAGAARRPVLVARIVVGRIVGGERASLGAGTLPAGQGRGTEVGRHARHRRVAACRVVAPAAPDSTGAAGRPRRAGRGRAAHSPARVGPCRSEPDDPARSDASGTSTRR